MKGVDNRTDEGRSGRRRRNKNKNTNMNKNNNKNKSKNKIKKKKERDKEGEKSTNKLKGWRAGMGGGEEGGVSGRKCTDPIVPTLPPTPFTLTYPLTYFSSSPPPLPTSLSLLYSSLSFNFQNCLYLPYILLLFFLLLLTILSSFFTFIKSQNREKIER